MQTAVTLIQIIVSITLIVILIIQMKGEGLSAFGDSSVYHQRRGLEATLFNITIVLAAVFVILSFVSALVVRGKLG
jgi:preprotein translocase subunit SecG